MKRQIVISLSVYSLLVFSVSCNKEESPSPALGKATFSLSPQTRNSSRVSETTTPAFVLLSIKDGDGNVQENIKLPLFPFGQSYLSENLELQTGEYELTQFLVLDESDKIIYATPLEGSDLAQYITDPLPMKFTITKEGSQIIPQVLEVLDDDAPESFGFASFGFEVISSSSTVLVKANVIIAVGGILYERLDATIRVKAYDSNYALKWTKDYNFVGPNDILEVRNGYHHYSIELVNKWGINDIQSEISGKEIWEGRADGPAPVTYNLAGSKEAKKLTSYVYSMEDNIPGKGIVYQPNFRVLYTYNGDGRLTYTRNEYYNRETSEFIESSSESFIYEGGNVSKIIKSYQGQPTSEHQYQYGAENKIKEIYYSGGGGTQTSFKTDYINNKVSVNYSFFNGVSFLFEFDVQYKNMVSDKGVRYGEICHEGNYTYDKNINPFKHLGYVNIYFENWSANNRLTEDVHYKACGFPVIIPVSHNYTYDEDGYPLHKITAYKSGSLDHMPIPRPFPHHNKIDFYYE